MQHKLDDFFYLASILLNKIFSATKKVEVKTVKKRKNSILNERRFTVVAFFSKTTILSKEREKQAGK